MKQRIRYTCLLLLFLMAVGWTMHAIAAASNADLNADGKIDLGDLQLLLSEYATTANATDLNADGTTNLDDLSIWLSDYDKANSAVSMCTTLVTAGENLQATIDNAAAGDTLCLAPGTNFTGDLKLQNSSGKASLPITITSQDATQPATITGRIVTWPGADYITLSWLNLNGLNAGSLPSLTIGSNHISLLHDDITNNHTAICVNDINDPTYGTAHYTVIDHNRIHDCGVLPATNYDHGIYETGYYATITNNYIYNNADRGIQLRGAQNATVEHNIVDGNGEAIIFGDLSASNNLVAHNIFSNSNQRYNVESYWGSAPVGTTNNFTDNCVWSTVTNGYAANQSMDPAISGVTIGNVTFANPKYTDAANHDYSLLAGSPCAAMAPQ